VPPGTGFPPTPPTPQSGNPPQRSVEIAFATDRNQLYTAWNVEVWRNLLSIRRPLFFAMRRPGSTRWLPRRTKDIRRPPILLVYNRIMDCANGMTEATAEYGKEVLWPAPSELESLDFCPVSAKASRSGRERAAELHFVMEMEDDWSAHVCSNLGRSAGRRVRFHAGAVARKTEKEVEGK
jgi:hypothetical protein